MRIEERGGREGKTRGRKEIKGVEEEEREGETARQN